MSTERQTEPLRPSPRAGPAPDRLDVEVDLPRRYEVVEELGRGGMGVVFAAFDTQLERPVAIKILDAALRAEPAWRQRFTREARAAAALDHPGVVTVYDVDPDARFIVMERVDGRSLAELAAAAPIDAKEVRRIGAAVLEALEAAHQAGVIHRDIKPSNVLIDRSGRPRLVDFGIASFGDIDVTATGAVVGTPAYMAPEQLRGIGAEARSDLYAVGATLFELATGRRLHDAMDLDVAAAVAEATGDPELGAALDRALADRPSARWPSAARFAAELARTSSTRGRRVGAVAVAGVAIVGLAAAVAIGWPSRDRALVSPSAELPGTPLSTAARVGVLPLATPPGLDGAGEALAQVAWIELMRRPDLEAVSPYRVLERAAADDPAAVERAVEVLEIDRLIRGAITAGPAGRYGVELVAGDVRVDGHADRADLPAEVERLAAELAGHLSATGPPPPRPSMSLEAEAPLRRCFAAIERYDLERAAAELESISPDGPLAGERAFAATLIAWLSLPPPERRAGSRVQVQTQLVARDPTLPLEWRELAGALEWLMAGNHGGVAPALTELAAERPTDLFIQLAAYEATFAIGEIDRATAIRARLAAIAPELPFAVEPMFRHRASRGEIGALGRLRRLPAGGPARVIQAVEARFAARDYAGALEAIASAREAGVPSAAAFRIDTLELGALALTGDRDAVVARIDAGGIDPLARAGAELAIALQRRADDRHAARDRLERAIEAIEDEGARSERWLELAPLYVASRVAELRDGYLDLAARWTNPDRQSMLLGIIRAHLGLFSGSPALLAGAASSPNLQAQAVAQAAEHRRARRFIAEAGAWRRALTADGPGWFRAVDLHELAITQLRAGDHAAVIEACDEVIRPRRFGWEWSVLAPDCLWWSADALRELGSSDEARALYRRLETLAPRQSHDPHRVAAERGLSATAPR